MSLNSSLLDRVLVDSVDVTTAVATEATAARIPSGRERGEDDGANARTSHKPVTKEDNDHTGGAAMLVTVAAAEHHHSLRFALDLLVGFHGFRRWR